MKLTVHIGAETLSYESYADIVRSGQKLVTKAVKLDVPIQLTNEMGATEFEGSVFEFIFYAADKAGTHTKPVPKSEKKRKREPVKNIPT